MTWQRCFGESSREAIEDFRNWKLNNDQNGKVLKKLVTASKTYLENSAECERGFSALNATATDARNRLRASSLSAELFIYLNGPLLHVFDPYLYIQSWLGRNIVCQLSVKRGETNISSECKVLKDCFFCTLTLIEMCKIIQMIIHSLVNA